MELEKEILSAVRKLGIQKSWWCSSSPSSKAWEAGMPIRVHFNSKACRSETQEELMFVSVQVWTLGRSYVVAPAGKRSKRSSPFL
jgi:hypothetical protein